MFLLFFIKIKQKYKLEKLTQMKQNTINYFLIWSPNMLLRNFLKIIKKIKSFLQDLNTLIKFIEFLARLIQRKESYNMCIKKIVKRIFSFTYLFNSSPYFQAQYFYCNLKASNTYWRSIRILFLIKDLLSSLTNKEKSYRFPHK